MAEQRYAPHLVTCLRPEGDDPGVTTMPDGPSDARTQPHVPLRDRVRTLWAGGPFREALVRRADIRPGHRVLDLGCGRGAPAFLMTGARPAAGVSGLDAFRPGIAWVRRHVRRNQSFREQTS